MAHDQDLTDAQWSLIEPFIPSAKEGGRPRSTDPRQVINAVFYLLRTGCQWRELSRISDFPPWQTCYRYFIHWRRKGVWRKLHHALLAQSREAVGRTSQPTALVIDSQTIKSSNMARNTGYDGGKRIKGRKRHMVVDTDGSLVEVAITPANRHDTHGAKRALRRVAKRYGATQVKAIFADKGYGGKPFAKWVRKQVGADMHIGNNPAATAKRFIPQKKRWVVERTFAWISACRRLAKDYERDARNCITMIKLAFIRLLVRRVA
ncbi:IS5 family transposase [Roseomonas gilardii]|uniref:IS5 family transposase n=1 Tax=Roseomonas gilardii TaxID=257708 RepID=UPI00138E1E61|nr:IS5 family transposase [Roseomonas gilardii]